MRVIRDRRLTYSGIRENIGYMFADPERATDRVYGIISSHLPNTCYYDIWSGEILIYGNSKLRKDDVLELVEKSICELLERF
jgi:hypothetical protein